MSITTATVLDNLLPPMPQAIPFSHIKFAVCAHFGLTFVDLDSARRGRYVARPRQIAMYLGRQLTGLSLPQIGKHLGNRDHTTILWGCRQIEALLPTRPDLAEAVAQIRGRLLSPRQETLPLSNGSAK